MKSDIFNSAIKEKKRLRFLYGAVEVYMDPYLILIDNAGKKTLYGYVTTTGTIAGFEYTRIANIHILDDEQNNPIIPLHASLN